MLCFVYSVGENKLVHFGNRVGRVVFLVKKAAFHIEQQSVAEKVAMIFNVDLSKMSVDPRQIPQLKKLLKG